MNAREQRRRRNSAWREAARQGHTLGGFERRAFVVGESAQCRDCGRQVLLMLGGELHGDGVTVECTGPRERIPADRPGWWRGQVYL